jgi:hypothetical protein
VDRGRQAPEEPHGQGEGDAGRQEIRRDAEGEDQVREGQPIARSTAISRARSATAEYMVLSAPKTAPSPMTTAISVPRTVMSA